MSERALKRILMVAGGVVALYLVTLLVGGGGGEDGGADALADFVAAIEPDRIRAMRFVREGDTIRLEESPEGWRVETHPADSGRVARFLEDLGELATGGVVARNPENHGRLGVSEEEATTVTLVHEDGGEATLLVGNPGPTAPSAYVRLPGGDPVYVLEGTFRNAVRRDVDQWRNRRIAAVDTSGATTVEVTREGATYTLSRGDEGWRIDGEEAAAAEVRSLLGELASLEAAGFAPDTAALPEVQRRVRVLGGEGEVLAELAIAEPEEGTYWLTSGEVPTVYEISSFRVDRLTPDPESLRAEGGDDGGG